MQRTRFDRTLAGFGLLLSLVLFSTGCSFTHIAYLSDHWMEQPQGLYPASVHYQRPTLQVIITYDGPLSSHAALRLAAEHGNVTFWDPAGAYGLRSSSEDSTGKPGDSPIIRVKDLIMSRVPDIPEYIQFRWEVGDVTVEVYEWDLPLLEAKRLEEVLRKGTNGMGIATDFHTETAPAFCTVAISQFLRRFAGRIMNLTDWYLWPHNLAQALLHQAPARIRVFQRDNSESTYVAPHRSAATSPSLTELVKP